MIIMKQNFIIILLSLFFGITAHAEQTLVINTSYESPITSPDHSGALDQFYQELGRRLGIKIEIQFLPAERCLLNADGGIDDGDVGRIKGLDKTYTNLRMVPEAVMNFELVAFSRNANFTVNNAESLKPYHVGIVTGWKILERTIVDTKSLEKVENRDILFSLLDKERIDVAVIENMMGLLTIQKNGYRNIKVLQPSLIKGEWYLYLHKKHEALIPKIAAEIKAMKDDGTHKRIFDGVLRRFAK
jgi:polar amino acid transport system substrate-binding protein